VGLVPGRELVLAVDGGPDAGTYHVRCLPKDFPGFTARRFGQPQAGWYVLALGYNGFGDPDYTAVFDNHGVPVWWMRDSKGMPFNASLLSGGTIAWYTYTGGQFGVDKSVAFKARTLEGKVVHTYRARGGPTDFHELQVLPNHHALLIRYKPRDHVDLSRYGKPSDATVVDGEIQEVDRHGNVKWRWSTKDHIALAEADRWLPSMNPATLRDHRQVYDPAHLNTVDPHGKRLVISLRYADAVYEIDKPSGRIVWKLGGTHTSKSLDVVGDPLHGTFGGQHDARLSADGRFLTLFDNRTRRSTRPRAVEFQIDAAHRRATFLQQVTYPGVKGSACCGGARLLPGGDWVISWGRNRYVTETDPSGNPLLVFDFNGRSSYRVFPVLPGGLDPARLRAGMNAMAH
jgi:hypothetical protein